MPNHDPAKGPSDEQARVHDIALRKKKNADAQAAFRARRASYIATLEETVTNLESVVLQLQESCHDARSEAAGWKKESARARLELREREKYWRCFWQSRKSSHPNGDDLPSLPPPVNAAALLQPPGNVDTHVAHQQHQYSDQNINYRNDDSCTGPPAYPRSDHSSYTTTSPSIPMVEPADPTLSPDDPNGRLAKYGHFSFSVQAASPRDSRWPIQHHPPGNTMSGTEPHQPSQSPVYQSPSLAATEISYSSRPFGGAPEEDKLQLHAVLDTAPYIFSNDERYDHRPSANSVPESRPLSPSSSTPASTSTALAPVYPFTFPEPGARFNDRGEIEIRRHSLPHAGEVTLIGGTADLSSLSGLGASDALSYRFGTRKSGSDPDPQHSRTTPMPPIPNGGGALGGNTSKGGFGSGSGHHDRLSSDSDSNGASLTSRPRRRRGTQHTSSRSPSPGPPSLSCTVAVIKAQAFGALRRTRARGKKSSEGAAKVAMDVLEARGIGIGGPTSSKRPRLDNEELAMET